MVGDRTKGQLDPECCMDLGQDDRANQRVAAEVEEIVVSSDIRNLKRLRPDFRKQFFRLRSRRVIPALVANRKRVLAQRFSIDLVTLIVRQTIQKQDS